MKIGFPDALRFNSLSGPLADIRRDLTQASVELVTGRKQNLGRVLGVEAGDYNIVAKALADADTSIDRLTLSNNRLSATQIPLHQIRTALTDYAVETDSLLVTDEFVNTTISADAKSQIRQIFTSLNSSYAGRNLFSGDSVESAATSTADEFFTAIEASLAGATDAATLDTAIDTFFAPGGDFDTLIYQGGAGFASAVRLPTGGTVSFQLKADDQSFRTALEGLVRVAYAPQEGQVDFAREGVTLVRNAEALLIQHEAELGRQQNLIDNSIDAVNQERLILAETENTFAGADPYEAAALVQNLELQLQTAYTVTARISRLTLTNFVR
ncbi:flagellin [Parvularcula marina]|uniref:Flagellin C-terminal domain-containing protein n=2 Tax=Parvularcula marina TaxID=2292771 RepID=A0A371RH46_9PROT|nr:flagellin [Parvularcula marina]RFB04745.1 hypothetical protein DX908_05290 [Parvularcula marina]